MKSITYSKNYDKLSKPRFTEVRDRYTSKGKDKLEDYYKTGEIYSQKVGESEVCQARLIGIEMIEGASIPKGLLEPSLLAGGEADADRLAKVRGMKQALVLHLKKIS